MPATSPLFMHFLRAPVIKAVVIVRGIYGMVCALTFPQRLQCLGVPQTCVSPAPKHHVLSEFALCLPGG